MSSPSPWVLISGDFRRGGGMDRANLELALYLAEEKRVPVHLVSHFVENHLAQHPLVTWHRIPRPVGLHMVGERILNTRGRFICQTICDRHPEARVIVNGGNCVWPGINWAHYVHHVWDPENPNAPWWFRSKDWLHHKLAKRDERAAFEIAQFVITNSEVTRQHVMCCFGLRPDCVRTVYLGSDPNWGEVTPLERREARSALGIPESQVVALFVGALGFDRRKGFDLLLEAWVRLQADHGWDVDLMAAGGGAVSAWQRRIDRAGLGNRIRLCGFSTRVRQLLAAADLLVSPARYEAYGLNVQEALCRGIPALISNSAGIAERYSADLAPMLIPDPENVSDLIARLRAWRRSPEEWKTRFQPLGRLLRSHTWRDMASEITGELEDIEQATRAQPIVARVPCK
jgi:glycosyltransferase involved in cell wall biosynthesis